MNLDIIVLVCYGVYHKCIEWIIIFVFFPRNCCFSGPDSRERTITRKTALEMALMKFADRTSYYIICPTVGTEFDDYEEAYEYYNLYFWEVGFGIRWGKRWYSDNRESRKVPMEKRYKLGQEFNCSCSVSACFIHVLYFFFVSDFIAV